MTKSTPSTAPSSNSENIEDSEQTLQEETCYQESRRSLCTGYANSGLKGLILVVAVTHFEADETHRALLASAGFIGLLLTPFSSWIVSRTRLTVTQANTIFFAVSALGMIYAAAASSFSGYFWGLILSMPLISTTIPNLTTLWRQNIKKEVRGQLFSRVVRWSMFSGLIGTILIALWLRKDPSRYPPILFSIGLALFAASYFSFKTRSRPLERQTGFPLTRLSILWKDRPFGYISLAWTVMGFGNLSTMPLRVEFMSLEKHDPWIIVLVYAVVPEVTRILSVQFWGRAFDRMNFLVMRIVLNLIFALSIGMFFIPGLPFQVLSSLLLGLGFGGGEIAWNLWITKFAPEDRTTDYMSVHTFLAGCRGVLGPLIAYAVLKDLGIQVIGWMGTGMVVLAAIMLIPMIPYGKKEQIN